MARLDPSTSAVRRPSPRAAPTSRVMAFTSTCVAPNASNDSVIV
jgi:hypothetical protein